MSLLPTHHFHKKSQESVLPKFVVGHDNGVDELFLYHFRHLLEIARHYLALLFSVVGIGLVFLWMIRQGEKADLSMLLEESGIAVLFWLSIISALLAIYFFQHRRRDLQYLARHPQKKPVDISWYLQEQAKQALSRAVYIAFEKGATELLPVFLFQSLLFFPKIKNILQRLGLHESELMARANEKTSALPVFERIPEMSIDPLLTSLHKAAEIALAHGGKSIALEDLFLAVLDDVEEINILFAATDVSIESVRQQITMSRIHTFVEEAHHRNAFLRRIKPKKLNRAMTARSTPLLDSYSDDMTTQAHYNLLSPCINRVEELTQLVAALERPDGSAFLSGATGVGKLGIVQGLANAMAEERVPEPLQDKRLVFVRASEILSEQKPLELMAQLFQEVRAAGNMILVFDAFSTLTGRGASALALTDLIEPLLAESTIHVIAMDTPENFSKYIDPHPELLKHFQVIHVEEADLNLTMCIIASRLPMIEKVSGVMFGFQAIKTIVEVTSKYVHGIAQPEKSLDVLEEVASYTVTKHGRGSFVTDADVREVFRTQTGVNVTKPGAEERSELLNLEMLMHERVIGQDEAVAVVANALRRGRAGLASEKRPMANFLFVGPTGVGKTEVAKVLARTYFGDEHKMIRLDMSEFQGIEGVTKLLGGLDANGNIIPGRLTDAVKRSPSSLILLDEFEKAAKETLQIFLQILDDGRATSSSGEVIDFTQTLILATSNAGSKEIEEALARQRPFDEIQKNLLNDILPKVFAPELLNRFDAIVPFQPLGKNELVEITRILVCESTEHLAEYDIHVEVSDELITHIVEQGFDPRYNARTIRRLVQGMIADPLAKSLLEKPGHRGEVIRFLPDGSIART